VTIYALTGAAEAGLVFGLVAMGVFLSFRVLDFPDLTVDGSFALGAAVAAVAILNRVDPYAATLAAAAAGFAAGYLTATLHVRLNILHLLASILVMLALYSVNLRIMGRPNLPLLASETVFTPLRQIQLPGYFARPAAILVFLVAVKLLLDWFLRTEIGLALRAIGANGRMAAAHGIERAKMLPLGLGISNALVAVAGAIFAQSQGFADVGMGVGVIIIGLAAVILGETLLSTRTIGFATAGAIMGSVAYRVVIAFALNLDAIGLRAQDLNLITALLIVAAIAATRIKSRAFGLASLGLLPKVSRPPASGVSRDA
jgi:putative ABC transport system permease protein